MAFNKLYSVHNYAIFFVNLLVALTSTTTFHL